MRYSCLLDDNSVSPARLLHEKTSDAISTRSAHPLVIPEVGVPLGNGVNASETIMTRSETKVMVESGRSILVEGVKTDTKNSKVQTLIIVGAKVVDK